MPNIGRSIAWTLALQAVIALTCLAIGSARAQPVDRDKDGIDDNLERALLAKFTPVLRFSRDGGVEKYRPMDARQYLQWSELQSDGNKGQGVLIRYPAMRNNPSLALTQDTNLSATAKYNQGRFLSPMDNEPQPGQWARHGFAWSDVLRLRNVGLYGHVVPIRIAPPQTDFLKCPTPSTPAEPTRDHVLCSIDGNSGRQDTYYKVEYWQFFGYNGVGKPFDLGDHEGDWMSVQLVVDPGTLAIVQVHHFFHGQIAAFDLRKYPRFTAIEGGRVREFHGPNFPMNVSATHHKGPVGAARNRDAHRLAQNNVVRLAQDPHTGEFTHPVVYVEHGGHEFWPTDAWSFQDSPKHGGDDREHSYMAAPPPNLGEVEFPLSETADAAVILNYSGRWGAYSKGIGNYAPQGPALHDNWTWPAQSSVRWRLQPKENGF